MARDVDTIIEFVRKQSYIPPVLRQVMIGRLDPAPTREEIDAAKAIVYPDIKHEDPWKDHG